MPKSSAPAITRRFAVLAVLSSLSIHAFGQGASSPEQLLEQYKSSLRTKNFDSFLGLYAWSTDQDKSFVERQFRRQIAMRIESAKIVPFAVHEQRFKKAAARLGKAATAVPEAWAELEFAWTPSPGGGIEQESSLLAIIRRDGRYFIGW